MYSDNKRISGRQVYRLFLFAFVGLSTLILPSELARQCGTAGWLCIVLGGCLGILYLALLKSVEDKLNTDLLTWLRNVPKTAVRKTLSVLLGFYCACMGAVCLRVFAEVMREYLAGSSDFAVVAAVILIVAVYAVAGGMESWARIYEILFWFIFLPFALMLAVGGFNMELSYLTSGTVHGVSGIWKGSYFVFVFLQLSFWGLFLPECTGRNWKNRQPQGELVAAMSVSLLILLAVYQIVLGNFGEGALSHLPYPAITLMSTIQVSGNFIKRLDAVMLAVWFFTLSAFLTLMLYFGAKMLELFFGERPKRSDQSKRRFLAGIAGIIAALVMAGRKENIIAMLYYDYILYVGVLMLVALPLLIYIRETRSKRVWLKERIYEQSVQGKERGYEQSVKGKERIYEQDVQGKERV